MARDATARLYDVDARSVKYTKPEITGKYDHGTIAFKAKKGKLVDLDKLHESTWATRLSGGTRSGLVHLDVTVVATVVERNGETVARIVGSKRIFKLVAGKGKRETFNNMKAAVASGKKLKITGRVAGWGGRWPNVLRRPPSKPRRIVVASFEVR